MKNYSNEKTSIIFFLVVIAMIVFIPFFSVYMLINNENDIDGYTDTEITPSIEIIVVKEPNKEITRLKCDEEIPNKEPAVSGNLSTSDPVINVTYENVYSDYSYEDVAYIAKTIYGEADGIGSLMEKAAVAWTILNRVDKTGYGFGNSIEYVVTFPGQFDGYNPNFPVTEENKMIAEDVLQRWTLEKSGEENVGRVLPKEYLYFIGDGKHNHFSSEWKSTNYWDWSLPNPYNS